MAIQDEPFVTIGAGSGLLTAERALTGTADQIVVTDNGANSTVVLSLISSAGMRVGANTPTMGLVVGGASQIFDVSASAALFISQGASGAPVSRNYRSPALYLERWDSSNPSSNDNPNYGNTWLTPIAEIEGRALSTSNNTNPNGLAIRMRSEHSGSAGSDATLTGATILAQLNPSGQNPTNYGCFGLNVIAAWQAGAAPPDLVGIEVDVVNANGDAGTAAPGTGGANNYTGIWIQQAAAGRIANTGLYISHDAGGGAYGWRYGTVLKGDFDQWMGKWENNSTGGTGYGLSLTIAYDGNNNRPILECRCGTGTERFVVMSDGTNPVYVMVGSALKQVSEGAANSGGTGYKVLRVLN